MSDRDYAEYIKLRYPQNQKQLLDINGEIEYIENITDFGDLIEKKMGTDASQYYFSTLRNIEQ